MTMSCQFSFLNFWIIVVKVKVELSRKKSWRLGQGEVMWDCHHHFYIRHNQDGIVVSSKLQPKFTVKENPWYSFLLAAGFAPGLLNAYRKNSSLEWNSDCSLLKLFLAHSYNDPKARKSSKQSTVALCKEGVNARISRRLTCWHSYVSWGAGQ